jgi:hypothetical protein
MFRVSRLLVAAALTLAVAAPASAAVVLAPLFTVPGLINHGTLATYFACTNADTVAATVGVEVFDQGGIQLTNESSNATSLAPHATILFGTQTSLALVIDCELGATCASAPGDVTKGSAIILTSSKKIVCTAFVADSNGSPPASMTNLTIVRKGKQKGD